MFKEKFRKVIATLLIICIVMSNNGVAVFADSTSEFYENATEGGSQQKATEYYEEYLAEMSESYSENNIDNNLEEDIVINEDDETIENVDGEISPSKDNSDKNEESEENKNGGNVLAPEDYDDNKKDAYEEEPEEDLIEEETTYAVVDDDNNTLDINEESKNEESKEETVETENVETEESETKEVESETEVEVETTLETNEETLETKEEGKETVEEEKETSKEETEKEVEEVKDATESEIVYKVVKRYIRATDSLVDDFMEHDFKIKKILLESKDASLSKNMAPEEIDKKYIKRAVKVLVEDQYGNEQVIRVKANWDYNFYVLGDEKSEKLKKENDEKLKQLVSDGIELKWDKSEDVIEDEEVSSYGSESNEMSDVEKEILKRRALLKEEYFGVVKEDKEEESTSLSINDEEEIEEDLGFVEEEEEVIYGAEADKDEIDSEEAAEDKKEVIIYEDEYIENGKVADEELNLENPIKDDALSDYISENKKDAVTEAVLNMEELAVSLQKELKKVYSKSNVTIDDDIIDEMPVVNLYGSVSEHEHPYCGLASCDGYSHLKYGKEEGTAVQDEIHETQNFIYLPTVTEGSVTLTTDDENIIKGYLQQGAVALQADWVIDRTYTVNDNIFICLNGHNIIFKNDNNYKGINPSGTGDEYNPGAIIVDASIYAKFSICNCQNKVSEVKAFNDGADLKDEFVRIKPCVEVRSLGNAYIFGKAIDDKTNNLIIKNIYQDGGSKKINSADEYNEETVDKDIDFHYNTYPAFLYCALKSEDSVTNIRQVRICNVDAKNLVGMAGTIVYAKYVNSFAMVDCHIDNCIAVKGTVCNIEYYSSEGANNDNAILLGTEVKNSSNYFGYDFNNKSTYSQLGHVDYCDVLSDYVDDDKLATLRDKYDAVVGKNPNGFILLKGYTSIENEIVRQFKYNTFENNKTYGTCSLFHFNSKSEKGTHFLNNKFTNNKSIIATASNMDLVYIYDIEKMERGYIINDAPKNEFKLNPYYSSALCVTFSNPVYDHVFDNFYGDINIYENVFENNDSRFGMFGSAGITFRGVNTVNISNRAESNIVNGDVFKGNQSSHRGAAIAFMGVNNVNMAATKIISNTIDIYKKLSKYEAKNISPESEGSTSETLGGAEVLGGAVYFENCNDVVIGNRGVDSEKFKVLFEKNNIKVDNLDLTYNKYPAVGGVGLLMRNCKTVSLYGTKFIENSYYEMRTDNVKLLVGGGLFVRAKKGFTSNLNIYGNTFEGNSAQAGGGIYVENVILTVADFLNYKNRNKFIKNTAYGKSNNRDYARGGAIFINPGYVTQETKITYADFGDDTDGNYAKFGGGIYVSENSVDYYYGLQTKYKYKVDALHKLNMTNVSFKNAKKIEPINAMHGGAIYGEHADIYIYEKVEIKNNYNAIYIKDSSIFTMEYSETYGAINQGKVIETPDISENKGEYVFGFSFGSTSPINPSSIVTYNLFGGGVKNNTMEVGITDYKIPKASGYNAGIFGYYGLKGENRPEGLRINVNIAGALNVLDNKRGEVLHNIPLEQGENKWLKLSMGATVGTTDYQLGYTAKVAFTPFDVEPLGTATGAKGYRLFSDAEGTYKEDSKYHYWTDIKDVDKGGSPQSVFRNDRNSDTDDSRAPFVNPEQMIFFENEANLITYEFDMITHPDMQIASQKISAGSTLYKPFKPQSITDEGGMLTNEEHTVRALDIMGRVDDDQTFAPWDFDKTIHINENVEEQPTNLYLIYQLLSHKHKVCGGESESCSHSDGANHYEDYGFFGDESNMFDDEHASIEVAAAQQLFYAFYYPKYMYVLTQDVVIPEKIYGRDTKTFIQKMIDQKGGIKNLKLCLNGYKLTIANGISMFNLIGDSYICDCSLNTTDHHAGIDFDGTTVSSMGTSLVTFGESGGVSNLSIYGTQDLYDKIKIENFKYSAGNGANGIIRQKDSSVSGKLYIEYTEFNKNELAGTMIENKGSVYLDNVDFNENKITNSGVEYSDNKDTMFDRAVAVVKARDDGSNMEHEFNQTKFIGNVIEEEYGSVVLLNERYNLTSLNIEKNVIKENQTKGFFSALTLAGNDNRGVFNIIETEFSKNVGGALMIENYNNVSIAISNIEKCKFDGNSLVLNENSKRFGGGAVYISGVGNPEADPGQIVFTRNEFTNNEVKYSTATTNDKSKGGALYISNSQTIESDNDLFKGNVAKYGSAIYDNQEDIENMPFAIQRKWNKTTITENGNGSTEGAYYINIPVSKNITEEFVDLSMTKNKGEVPGFYVENVYDGNSIKIEGTSKITENVGGPIIYVKPTDSSKHNGNIDFDTDNINIASNSVGDRNAIEVSGKDVDGDSAVDGITTMRFSGIVRITANKNSSGEESNIRVSKNLVLDAFNKKLNATKVDGEYRSKIGVNTTTAILDYVKDEANGNYGEINMFTWTPAVINGFSSSGILSEEVVVIDEKSKSTDPEKDIVVFKGTKDQLAIGYKKNTKEIKAYLSDTEVYKKMHVRLYNTEVYLDNFADLSTLRTLIPEEYRNNYGDVTPAGWMSTNTSFNFVTWSFNSTKYIAKNDTNEGSDVYALWQTKHGHTSTNVTNRDTSTDWFITYDENILFLDLDKKYVLSKDIVLDNTITDTVGNYTICMNGYNMTTKDGISLVNLTDNTKPLGFSIINCKDTGILNPTDLSDDTIENKTPFINFVSSSENDACNLNLTNIKMNNFNYKGEKEGAIIHIEYGRLNAKDLVIVKDTNTKKIYSETSLIYTKNGLSDYNGLTIKDIDGLKAKNGILYVTLDNTYRNVARDAGTTIFNIAGKLEIENNKINIEGVESTGKDNNPLPNMSLFRFENILSPVKIDVETESKITNNEVGSIFLLDGVSQFTLKGRESAENTPTLKITDNKCMMNAVIKIKENTETEQVVSSEWVDLKNNHATYLGSVLQYISDYQNEKGVSASFNNVVFEGNETSGIYYKGSDGYAAGSTRGGAIFIGNSDTTNVKGTIKNTLSITNATSIKNNKVVQANYLEKTDENALGGGGFLYAQRTKVTIAPRDGETLDITGNTAEVDNGKSFTKTLAADSYNEQLAQGGVAVLSNCIFTLGGSGTINVKNNKADEVSAFYVISNLFGAIVEGDVSTDNIFNIGSTENSENGVVNITANEDNKNGGAVKIKGYMNLAFNNTIVIATNSTTLSGVPFVRNFYAVDNVLRETLGVSRKILSGFNYDKSFISGDSEYADDYIATGYLTSELSKLGKIFHADDAVNDIVYSTDDEEMVNKVVHIGNSRMEVRFILGPGVTAKNKTDQGTYTTNTKDDTTREPLINGFIKEMNQSAMYFAASQLKNPTNEWEITRSGYTLEGWVTWIYNKDNDERRELGTISDFENQKVFGKAADGTVLNVYAVWSNNGYNNNLRACGDTSCNHENGATHSVMTKWIEVVRQETLYYESTDMNRTGFYNDSPTGYVEVDMAYGPIKAKVLNVSGMQKTPWDYSGYGGNPVMLVDKNTFVILVNKKHLLENVTPLFVDHDIILSVKAKENETDNYKEINDSVSIKDIGPGIYSGSAVLDLTSTPQIKYAIGGLSSNLYQGSTDVIDESLMTGFDVIKSEGGTVQIYGAKDRHFNLGRFGSTGFNKIIKTKNLILENADFVRNINMQIEAEIVGVNIYDSNMYLNKFVTAYPATDSVTDYRMLYSLIKLNKSTGAGEGKMKKILAYKNTVGQYIYLDMPTLTNGQNLNLDFSKTIKSGSLEITGAKENAVFSVNNEAGVKLDTALIASGPNDDTTVTSNTSNPLITVSGTIDKNYQGSEYFDYIIDAYGASLTLASGSTIKDNTVEKDLIRVAHGRKNLSFIADHTTITGNVVTPNGDSESQGYVIRRESPQTSEDSIHDTVIKNNMAKYAFYNVAVSGMNKVELGGKIEIYENFNIANEAANFAVTDHQSTQTLVYSTENKLNYKSKIGVSVLVGGRRITDNEGYISYKSWTSDMRAENNDEAEDIGGTTDSVFISDDDNYIVYKTTTNDIKVIKKRDKNKYVEVHYEYYAEVEETFDYQYVAVGASPDHPGVPVSKKGETFVGWYTSNNEDSVEFDFTGSTTPVKAVNNIATMYAIWDREVKITIHRNGSGSKVLDDGTRIEYGNIIPSDSPFSVDKDVVYVGRMGDTLDTIIDNVTRGTENYDAYTIDDNGNRLQSITSIVEYRRDGTAWSVDGWWTKNGWNNGAGDQDWGEKYDPTSGQIIVETADYYVRWVGRDVTLYLNLQDHSVGGDDFGSTDAELVEGTYDEDDSTGSPVVTLHYLTTIDKLPEVTRSGYKFIAWHSSPSESFSDNNIIKAGQYLALEGAEGSDTLYAEWEPIKYTVMFMPDENTDEFTFATPTQVLTFDKKEKLDKNRYTRIGYENSHWDYFSEEVTEDRQIPNEHVFNEESWDNLIGVDGAVVKLYVNWQPQNFTLTFALNDKEKGDDRISEGYYKGTTTSEDAEEAFSEEEGTPVHYGEKLGNIGDLPTPTREGYQFAGWWTKNDGTGLNVTKDTTYDFESATCVNSDGAKIATSSIVYAKWIPNKYKIVFDTNSMETEGLEAEGEMEEVEALFDKPVTIPANKFKSKGFTFNKMTFENDDRGIVYDVNNKGKELVIDDKTDLYNFGYNRENLGIATGAEIVLYANWTIHTYNLKYVGNPPNGRELSPNSNDYIVEGITYAEDVELIDAEDKWAVEGYAFDKWTLVKDIKNATVSYTTGDVLSKLASITPDDDTVETFSLYAQWVKNPYFISYNAGEAGGGEDTVEGSLNTQRLSVDDDKVALYPVSGGSYTNLDGTVVDAGPGFSVVGYTFDYWRDTETGLTYVDKASVSNIRTERDSEAEFEANWKPNTYRLKFDKNIPISSLSGATNEAVGSNYYEMLQQNKTYNPSRPASVEHSGQMIEYPTDVTVDLIDSQDDPQVKINGYIMTGFVGQDGEVYRSGTDSTFNRKAGTSSVADSIYELKYTWTPGLFSLELNYNDSETSPVEDDSKDSIKAYYDRTYDSYEPFVKPRRAGYDFVGWTLNKAYGPKETPSAEDLISTKSILRKYNADPTDEETPVDTLYAYWIPKKYNLTVNANTLNGQDGYYKIATTTNAEGFTKELTYNIVAEFEQPIGNLDSAYLQGYKFNRYDKSRDGDEEEVTKDTLYWAIEDQTIYAIYTPITYKVVFKASASDVDGRFDDLTLTYDGDPYQLPTIDESVTITSDTVGNMTRKGYTFVKWEHTNRVASPNNINTSKAQYYENEDEVVNLAENENDVAELSAMWREHNYTIIYDSNAPESPDASFTNNVTGTMENVTLPYTKEYTMPVASYSIVGYKFIGWANTANAKTPLYKAGEKVSKLASGGCGDDNDNEEITMYAVWENEVYTITLNLNDAAMGNGTTDASYETAGQKTKISIAYDTPYRDAYVLEGTNKKQQNIGVIEVQGDQDVKAKRDGYRFMGWSDIATIAYAERARNLISYDEIYRLATDSEAYAVWENNQYTMTFEAKTRVFGAEEPENPANMTVWFDMPYGENEISGSKNLPTMTFPPYTFGGWFFKKDADWDFTSPNGSPTDVTKMILNTKKLTKENFDTIDENGIIDVYAYWGGTLFNIVMDANGGKVYDEPTNTMADKTTTTAIHQLPIKDGLGHLYTEDEEVTINGVKQKKVNRTGYTFKGWWSLKTKEYPYSATEDTQITDDTVYWNEATGSTVYAKWEANQYDVAYVVNLPQGSTTTGTVEYSNGELNEAGLLKNIELTYDQEMSGTNTFAKVEMKGYKFLGWYTRESKDDNSGIWLSGEKASPSYIWKYEDINKIYGQWDVNSYVITWDMNKGDGSTEPRMTSGKATTSQVFDTEILATSAPKVERDGYTFDGFYTKKGVWAGADGWDRDSADNNGWGDRVDLGKLKYDMSIVDLNGGEAKDSTFYARWIPKEYTITFDGNKGNSTTDPYIGGKNTNVTRKILFDDSLSRYRYDKEITNTIPSGECDINFYDDNKGIATHYDRNDTTLITKTVKEGYTFKGWNTKADGTGDFIGEGIGKDSEYVSTANTTYYAIWEANKYVISFVKNDSSDGLGSTAATLGSETVEVTFDEKVPELPEATREGYEFIGWWTNEGWTSEYNINSDAQFDRDWGMKVAKDVNTYNFNATTGIDLLIRNGNNYADNITLYARWKRKTYKITYNVNASDKNNGSTEGKLYVNNVEQTGTSYTLDKVYFDLPVIYDNDVTLTNRTNVPTAKRIGYDFANWTIGDTTDIFDINTYVYDTTEENMQIKAEWTKKTFTINYGSNIYDEVKAQPGNAALKSQLTHSSLNGETDVVDIPNPAYFTVEFDSAMSNLLTTENSSSDLWPKLRSTGNRYGYTFTEFYTKQGKEQGVKLTRDTVLNKDLLSQFSQAVNMDTNSLVIYPNWKAHTYKVSFEKNINIQGVTPETMPDLENISFNEFKELPANTFSEDGFEFLGWNETPITDYSGTVKPKYYVANGVNPQVYRLVAEDNGSATLYATWKVAEIPITYKNVFEGDTVQEVPWDKAANSHLPYWFNMMGNTDGALPI